MTRIKTMQTEQSRFVSFRATEMLYIPRGLQFTFTCDIIRKPSDI